MFVLLLAMGPALGDSIKMKNLTHKDVKVTGVREGQLYFKTANGADRSVLLDEVLALELDKYPALGKANEAFAKEDFAGAARLLSPVVDAAKEDYVKVLAGAQLVAALDRTGKFLDASRRYVKLLRISASPLVKSVRPDSLPTDPQERAALAEKLAADLKGTTDPLAKDFLKQTIDALKSDAASAPVADGPARPRAGLLRTSAEAERDPVDDALAARKYELALKMTGDILAKGDTLSLARVLYQRGMAQAALGKDDEALLSFMRVVIHFSPRSGPYYTRSLVEAGKILAKTGDAGQARKAYAEAQKIYGESSEEGQKLAALIKELPQ